MSRRYCLSYLTLELSPPASIEIASETGYDLVGVRMMPTLPGGEAFPLMHDAALMRETQSRLADSDVEAFDIEIAMIDGRTSVETWLPMLEAAGRIGAKTVIAAGLDTDEARLTDTFGALCDAAAPFGLSINLEFTPWAPLGDLRAATRVVQAAGRPNGEVLVDTIHVARSATTLDDVRAVPVERMSYFQICDCPAETPTTVEGLLHTARAERLLPGEGGADLEGCITALPRDLIVSVEVPSHSRIASLGHKTWARTALEASREAMARYDAASAG